MILGSRLSDDSNYDLSCRSTNQLKYHDPPLLHDLSVDPGERYSLSHHCIICTSTKTLTCGALRYPLSNNYPNYENIIAEMKSTRENLEKHVWWEDSQTQKGENPSSSPCCNRPADCSPFPKCCDCDFKHQTHHQIDPIIVQV